MEVSPGSLRLGRFYWSLPGEAHYVYKGEAIGVDHRRYYRFSPFGFPYKSHLPKPLVDGLREIEDSMQEYLSLFHERK